MPDTTMLMIGGGAIGLLLVLASLFSGPSATKSQGRRLESVRERHSRSSDVATQAQLKKIMANRSQSTRAEGLASSLIPNPELLRKRLEQTGKGWTLPQYVGASAGLAVVTFAALFFRGAPALLALFVGLLLGAGLPHFIVGKLVKKRGTQFTQRFPDAIELMVRGLRSGLPISETVAVVGQEIQGPVGLEFKEVADKMRIGKTMEAALQDTADRLKTPEFQFFVISLAIQRETGGNLAETLGNLADVLRKRAQMKLKIKAMSSEAKASAWIVGSLPFIVFGLIYYMNAGYLANFFVDERLIMAGLGGLVWMGIGVFIMARMVNFEI
ncbi:type II secretion system F family protein [Sphingosinicella sp. YJ22]|uniref:type II secretion system F family protein n=1 Tax=Sphingosinicella sp. YJ22 TaxID=1104780 RepID=UPI00140C367D|nr:type II secretion system F family protein [Sphingosinicella sp. YJ22]